MHSRSRIFSNDFVSSVLQALDATELSTLGKIDFEGEKDSLNQLTTFLDSLFARTSPRVLRLLQEHSCVLIVKGCLKTLGAHDANPDTISHHLQSHEHWCGLFLALSDQPFLVSSIAECLYEQKIALNAFQHPIISFRGKLVAISYIEIASRSQNAIETKIPALLSTLVALKKVVVEHTLMLEAVRKGLDTSSNNPISLPWGNVSPQDLRDFSDWLASGTFFFLGTAEWSKERELTNCHGIPTKDTKYSIALKTHMTHDVEWQKERGVEFSIHKLPMRSIVHRRAPLIHIAYRKKEAAHLIFSIIGYFTSKARACEAEDIPLLNRKIETILQSEHTPPNSHDYKYVREVLDNTPLDDALRLPIEDLRDIGHTALGLFSEEETRINISVDTQRRWALTTLIFAPEKYSAEVQTSVQAAIETHLGAPPLSSEINLDTSKKRQLRLYVSTPLPTPPQNLDDLNTLEGLVQRATLDWEEQLAEHLEGRGDLARTSFPEAYQANISIAEAAHDFGVLSSTTQQAPLQTTLFAPTSSASTPTLTCTSLKESISLTSAIPILEHFGLEVLDANSYIVHHGGETAQILKFIVQLKDHTPIEIESFNQIVCPALTDILLKKSTDDPLNVLIVSLGLTGNQVKLLRCYCALLWQTYKIATKRTMFLALATNPAFVETFFRSFTVRFDPNLNLELSERISQASAIEEQALSILRGVSNISYDRILRALLDLLRNTVRTSFYRELETITLKLTSQHVQFMPHPRPLYELFVFSSQIEGTHLRSAKVARGGIRWSERLDDYRAEVLGLMKTQRVKNVIIVPTGAKGGFILKTTALHTPPTLQDVEKGYREYIAALLSITDNLINDVIQHPPKTVIHDESDPYLVVAADKGTATFSDVANTIAEEDYSFWLGDAFASGGSAGYDHKKYGITARGAWQSVIRHARDAGIDLESPFTTIGIGDMSGDVFGNAMLLSNNISLIGAFNHKHIFIDPTPDLERSYRERERLFLLPRSQWSDYNPSDISEGGGVFDRNAKEIEITSQMRSALDIDPEVKSPVNGEQLISFILKSPAVLLWNGGIGTYVKSASETNAEVNDGSNDGVRIDADDLRCRIVGEGGNLGFTQLARIDCARRSIRINTDAIDNSGGVDLSDHEVNLKLLFQSLVKNKSLSTATRNELLLDVAEEVATKVLTHNQNQSLLLSMSELCSVNKIDQFRQLLRMLEAGGIIDRARDNLPDEQELEGRGLRKQGMLRPELALCSAGVKMWLKGTLIDEFPLQEEELEPFLLSYFPIRLQREYQEVIRTHPLYKEIVTNQIVETATLSTGISFIPSRFQESGERAGHIVKCCIAANEIMRFDQIKHSLEKLDTYQSFELFSSTLLELTNAIIQATTWLLTTHPHQTPLSELIALYATNFHILLENIDTIFSPVAKERFDQTVERYEELGLSIQEAKVTALSPSILEALEVLWSMRQYGQGVPRTLDITRLTLDTLKIRPLFDFEFSLSIQNKWDQELASSALQKVRRGVSHIVGKLLTLSQTFNRSTERMLLQAHSTKELIKIMSEINEDIKAGRTITISVLPLVAQYIERIHSALENQYEQ